MILRVGPWRYTHAKVNYIPERGEIIWARRTPVDRYLRAVVRYRRRIRDGRWKIRVVWLESDHIVKPPILVATDGWLVLGTMSLIKKWEPDPPPEQVRP